MKRTDGRAIGTECQGCGKLFGTLFAYDQHRFFPEIAGGWFHFKKDHTQYSLKPEDYANKPLFLA